MHQRLVLLIFLVFFNGFGVGRAKMSIFPRKKKQMRTGRTRRPEHGLNRSEIDEIAWFQKTLWPLSNIEHLVLLRWCKMSFFEKNHQTQCKSAPTKTPRKFCAGEICACLFFCHWSLEILLFLMSRTKNHYVAAAIWPGFFFFARHAAWECKK